jgi:hypothetical protein
MPGEKSALRAGAVASWLKWDAASTHIKDGKPDAAGGTQRVSGCRRRTELGGQERADKMRTSEHERLPSGMRPRRSHRVRWRLDETKRRLLTQARNGNRDTGQSPVADSSSADALKGRSQTAAQDLSGGVRSLAGE